MGWRCEWRTVCDQCGDLGSRGPGAESRDAERRALAAGWLAWEGFYGRFFACPACRTELNDDLAASLAESNEVRGASK